MTYTIELKKYPFNQLIDELMKIDKINDRDKLKEILLLFGEEAGGTYFILYNEYAGDENCYSGVMEVIDLYFKIRKNNINYDDENEYDSCYEAFDKLESEMDCSCKDNFNPLTAYDILGVDFYDEDDEEEDDEYDEDEDDEDDEYEEDEDDEE